MPLRDFLPETDELPDQFEPDDSDPLAFQFPCCACKHRDRDERACMGCAHYLN